MQPMPPPRRGLAARLRIGLRVLALTPAFLIGLPAQWLALKAGSPLVRHLPVLFHRYVTRVMGVRVEILGRMAEARPLLLAANHLSWLDIVVLSSVAPVSFVAKSEVGTWPLFGTLARLQRSVFVERARRAKTAEVNRAIAERLSGGDALILFAEGTTSDGSRVLPFRSALIGAAQGALGAEGGRSYVQPMAIAYPMIEGLPAGRADLPSIAWFGDMDLVPHLGDFLASGGATARVTFGEPVEVGPGTDRKALTRDLEAFCRAAVYAARTGRSAAP